MVALGGAVEGVTRKAQVVGPLSDGFTQQEVAVLDLFGGALGSFEEVGEMLRLFYRVIAE